MKTLLAIAASAATFAGALAMGPGLASAQPYYDRHGDYRHDNGYHRGWDRRDHRRWGGYAWHGRHYVHRDWTCRWRHGDRVCFYRYW